MLSELKQLQKDKYCMISLYLESKVAVIIEVENKIPVTRGWGKERIRVGTDYSKFNVINRRNKFWCSMAW